MNHSHHLVCVVALAAASVSAQVSPPPPPFIAPARGYTEPGNPAVAMPNLEFDTAAPKEQVAAGPAGTVHTNRAVYVAFWDRESGADKIKFARSTDGGVTWQPAVTLTTRPFGESVDGTSFQVVAWEHQVHVISAYGPINATSTPPTAHNLYIQSSRDQGQNWSAPFLINTGIGAAVNPRWDVDEARAAVDDAGIVHIVWENDYQSNQSQEDLFYASIVLDGAGNPFFLTSEVRVTQNFYTANTFDVDEPRVAAAGNTVVIGWADDRAGFNNCYTVVSNINGVDIGTVAEVDHTQLVLSARVRPPEVAVAGTNIYVAWDDNSQGGQGDEVYVDFSNDAGSTWNGKIKVTNTPANDVDGVLLAADGQRAVIAYDRDLTQSGLAANSGNRTFAQVDSTAGAGWVAGTVPEIQVSNLTPAGQAGPPPVDYCNTLWDLDMFGDVIVIGGEEDWHNSATATGTTRWGEDTVAWFSVDGGQTYEHRFVTNVGSAFNPPAVFGGFVTSFDVDDPRFAYGPAGNIIACYGMSNTPAVGATNKFVVTGYRVPEIVDNTLAGNGVQVRLAQPAFRGTHIVALAVSVSGTTPALPLDPSRGMWIDVAFDPLTSLFLTAPALTIATTINAQGEADFPSFPNPRPFAPGVPFYMSSFSLNLTTGRWQWGGEAIVLQ